MFFRYLRRLPALLRPSMQPYTWPTEPTPEIQNFERRHKDPEAGALLYWAALCVDELHYLDDLDRAYEARGVTPHGTPRNGHASEIIDVSHARWAVSTCATAFDLCAAALARVYSGYGGRFEASMADYDSSPTSRSKKRKNLTNRSKLPPAALSWIDGVFRDIRYSHLREVRNALTHARLTRHRFVGGEPRRLELKSGNTQFGIRAIITDARETARDHVVALVHLLPAL